MYKTLDPFSERLEAEYDLDTPFKVHQAVEGLCQGFEQWGGFSMQQRIDDLMRVKEQLLIRLPQLARLMSIEMGKPIGEGEAELQKSARLIEYYALHMDEIMGKLSDHGSQILPRGVILGIMPWNYPVWQVFRFAVPTLLMGNLVLLKHAPNVPQSALAIQALFESITPCILKTVFVDHQQVEQLIEDNRIAGVSFTGSVKTGTHVAQLAAKQLKPAVLELGGSDAFIVTESADLETVLDAAIKGRCYNAGQVCIAAKRFLIHEQLIDSFQAGLMERLDALKMGNPLDAETQMGPMARADLLDGLNSQVYKSIQMGAKLVYQKEFEYQTGHFYRPQILRNLTMDMPVLREETFGPVFALLSFKDDDQCIRMANHTVYGLGASVWSQDLDQAQRYASQLEVGTVAINQNVGSDPAYPFGGWKQSGLGLELGIEGCRAFIKHKVLRGL